tara:strand:- start:43 stop:609 length:567 start_codon:yes stop_codon:yes gene_type:complete
VEKDTRTHYIDSYKKAHLHGYVSCDKCYSIVERLYKKCEENGHFIPDKIYKAAMLLKNIQFYRLSSNSNIRPYIHREATFNLQQSEIFSKYVDNRLRTLISWSDLNAGTLTKPISISNLLYNNRKIYGYCINNGPLECCAKIWHPYIKKEYNIANSFKIFLQSIYFKNLTINADIQGIIEEFWLGEIL